MSPGPVETIGAVEGAALRSDGLEVYGWVAPLDHSTPTACVVSLGHLQRTTSERRLAIRRPEIVSELPGLVASDACGFGLRVALTDAERRQLPDALVEVTPMFRTRTGLSVFGVAEPSLPLPRPSDQRAFGDDFLSMSNRLLGHCVNYAHLGRDDRVLDVGCGAGRLAYALSAYLSPSGSYDGFDANDRWIRSAREAIGTRFPRFAFRSVGIRHSVYNPDGAEEAAEFRFPYPSQSFDLVCAISVFQHNRPEAVRRYLREISRVLCADGRCLITCFLLSSSRREARTLNFVHPLEGSLAADKELPEIGIAHEQAALEEWSREAGLAVTRMREGNWRGGRQIFSWQDLLILHKPGPACSGSMSL